MAGEKHKLIKQHGTLLNFSHRVFEKASTIATSSLTEPSASADETKPASEVVDEGPASTLLLGKADALANACLNLRPQPDKETVCKSLKPIPI